MTARLPGGAPRFGARRIVPGFLRILAVAVVLFLAVIYLRLGYFVLLVHAIGAMAAILLTRPQRAGFPAVRSSLVAVAGYCVAVAVVQLVAVQHRNEVRDLAWQVVEQPGGRAPEVLLQIGGGDALYSTSAELRTWLESRSAPTVRVSLPVTRILGCFHSLGDPSIEGLGVVPMAGYMSGGPGAWEDHWWCP